MKYMIHTRSLDPGMSVIIDSMGGEQLECDSACNHPIKEYNTEAEAYDAVADFNQLYPSCDLVVVPVED